MKKVILLALSLFVLCAQVQVSAQKKEKKEKAKKEIKWEWDGTKSGNQKIDNYLVQIDTVYRNVREYQNNLESFVLKDTVLCINNKYYEFAWMENSQGEMLTHASVNWQFWYASLTGTKIILDMTNASLASANAALELPSLGLSAFKFAKYVKGGPAVISSGINAIKAVRGKWIANSRKWKAMKDGAVKDPSTIGYDGFSEELIATLNKCVYIKEVKEDAPEYEEIIKKFTGKTSEEIAAENEGFATEIAAATILPEEKSKALDELPDLEEELN